MATIRSQEVNKRKRLRKNRDIPQFIAVDGEGLTRNDGSHDYTLLAASTGSYIEFWGYGGLSTSQCFDFLLDLQSANLQAEIVGFSFGYDVNMMLRDFADIHLVMLHNDKWVYYRIEGRTYRVRYIPRKELYIAQVEWNKNTKQEKVLRSVRIWDVFGFFQTSFVKSLTEWQICSKEEADSIGAMKEQRGNFDETQRQQIIHYCQHECDLLVKLMEALAANLWLVSLPISKWHGVGAIAEKLLASKVDKMVLGRSDDSHTRQEVEKLAKYAYFGGRIENMATGKVATQMYAYDIRSAYPNEIRQLPDLQGYWNYTTSYDSTVYGLWHCKWKLPQESVTGPFPFRHNGSVYYPTMGEGWYWHKEVKAALPFGIDILEGYTYVPNDYRKPFEWLVEVYNERARLKRDGNMAQIPLKLGMNSLYGKFAQTVAFRNKIPAWQSFIYAGMITSGTRAKILDVLTANPFTVGERQGPIVPIDGKILGIMTDGIYSNAPLDLQLGEQLGDWEYEQRQPGAIMLQPGILFTVEGTRKDKTRGFNRNGNVRIENTFERLSYHHVNMVLTERGLLSTIPVYDTRFNGIGAVLSRKSNGWYTVNHDRFRRWIDEVREISFSMQPRKFPSDASFQNDFQWLLAHNGFDGMSEIYKKAAKTVEPQDSEQSDEPI